MKLLEKNKKKLPPKVLREETKRTAPGCPVSPINVYLKWGSVSGWMHKYAMKLNKYKRQKCSDVN